MSDNFMDSQGLNFDELELGGESGADEVIVVEDVIAESLGVSSLDEITDSAEVMDIDLDEISLGDDDNLSDAVLLRTGEDIVKTLAPYRDLAVAALTLINASTEKDIINNMVVDNAEFNYMPEDVFRTFNSILIDMATQEEYQQFSVEQCATKAISMLMAATNWSPTLHRPEFISAFCTWCTRFRKLNGTRAAQKERGLVGLLDADRIMEAAYFFGLNTELFVRVNNFFDDMGTNLTDAAIDDSKLGLLASSYMEEHGLNVLTIRAATECVMDYFRSEDLRHALKLSEDELLEYSIGELLRRLMVYEFRNEIIYPYGIKGRATNDYPAILECLYSATSSGSIASEIVLIIANIMSRWAYDQDSKDVGVAMEFLSCVMKFYQAYLRDDSLINPVFYGHVCYMNDGTFELGYAVNDETLTVKSNSILCDVVGDRSSVYCIPDFLVDSSHGYAICPPQALVTPLRTVAISGRMKIAGAVTFKFRPTINWLAENKVSAREEDGTTVEQGTSIRDADNPLLPVLLEYQNDFEDAGYEVTPVIVAVRGYLIYSVTTRQRGSANEIYLVEMEEDHSIIARSGTLLLDGETKNLIVTFSGLNGKYVEFIANEGEYVEEFLGSTADITPAESSLSDIVHCAKTAKVVEFQQYRKAVKSLCELAAIDYEEELVTVQEVIARELYHIVYIPAIDELVASRVLDVYYRYIEARKELPDCIDSFNFPSFKELLDIVLGRGNKVHGCTEWSAQVGVLAEEYRQAVNCSVDRFCNLLDRLDVDVLALQVLSRSEVQRHYDMNVYYAYHGIPEIDSRLCRLEDKMVALHVLDLLGDQVLTVFSKRSYLGKVYTSQVLKENIDGIHKVLVEKSRKRDIEFSLPLSKKILENQGVADDVVLKYFILERNVYGLLDTVYSAPESYEGCYSRFLEELGLPEMFDIKTVTQAEFSKAVPVDRITEFYEKNGDILLSWVNRGLMCEVAGNNGFQVIKAFDLFNSFYELIVGLQRPDEPSRYERDVFTYGGSFVISYCPVIDSSTGDIDGGETRSMAFAKASDDFVYDVPIDYLKQYGLSDIRVAIEGE